MAGRDGGKVQETEEAVRLLKWNQEREKEKGLCMECSPLYIGSFRTGKNISDRISMQYLV